MRISGFELTQVLEEQGSTSLYQGIRQKDGAKVLVELLNPSAGASQLDVEHFQERCRLLGTVHHHPGFARLVDHGEEKGLHYMATELGSERRLADYLKAGAFLGPSEATRLMLDLASTLKVLHDIGKVHGDINANNIDFGEDGHLMLRNPFRFRQTRESFLHLIGEYPQWVSPEHLRMKNLRPQSDQYVLGLLYYQLLTGEAAYDHADPKEVWKLHLEGSLPRLPKNIRSVPGLETCLDRLLAKHRSQCFESDRDLISALEEIEDHLLADVPSEPMESSQPPTSPSEESKKTPKLSTKSKVKKKGKSEPVRKRVQPASRKWKGGEVPSRASGRIATTRSAPPPPPSSIGSWLVGGVALLVIAGIGLVWMNKGWDPHAQSGEDPEEGGPRTIIRTQNEIEYARTGKVPESLLEKDKPKLRQVPAATPVPQQAPVDEGPLIVSVEEGASDEKIQRLREIAALPLEEAIPRMEAALEDEDDRVRFLANQILRDLRGGVLVEEGSLRETLLDQAARWM